MDPVRLARIRARVLAAAATVVIPACGGVPEHVNEPRKDPEVTPINEREPDGPSKQPSDDLNTGNPDKAPEPKHINTPAPDSPTAAAGESADGRDINDPNRPPAPPKALSPKDLPPPGQTINTAPTKAPTPDHVNTPPPSTSPAKPPKHINTPEPPR